MVHGRPQDWMREAGITVDALKAGTASPGLRTVIDRCLDGTDRMMATARSLPGALKSTRLSCESAVIVRIAGRLSDRLRREDPVATRVELSKGQFVACGFSGVLDVLFRRR